MPAQLEDATALLANPFEIAASRRAASIASLARPGAAAAWIARELGRHGPVAAERCVLATAHAEAFRATGRSPALLGPDVLPPAVLRALPRPRSAYVGVAAAAARCVRALDALVGTSTSLAAVRRATWAACFGDSLEHALVLSDVIGAHDVVIFGETGTGKEAIAHAIQEGCIGPDGASPAPRASLNAASVPETLIAAELFGHVKGAFTGASEARIGRIRSAHGGSLFLDEVGDLGASTQVKLLRVMETDEVSPLGSDRSYRAHCRYIAATHKPLEAMVEAGQFRRDLYQRLAGYVVRVPPLRDRPEDVVAIGKAFVARHLPEGALPETRRRVERWLASAEAARHAWPGNVRELQNALRNMLLGLDPGVVQGASVPGSPGEVPAGVLDAVASMDELVDWYVARVLARHDDNLTQASKILGIDRTTVRRRARALARRKRVEVAPPSSRRGA